MSGGTHRGHGDHAHGHGHSHGSAAARAGARHQRPLFIAFALIVGFLVVQVVVGLATGSLSLLSDAGHMATDALGLGMALAAIHAASTARANPQRTFGLYRLEILAALANAVLLFGVAGYVLYEAATRLGEDREIPAGPVLVVGLLGLAVNVVAFALLRAGAKESLNVRGAYLEVRVGHARLGGRRRRRHRLGHHGLDLGGPRARRRHRPVHPAPGRTARPRRGAHPRAGRAAGHRRRTRSARTWPASRAWSTCTTCTCGR